MARAKILRYYVKVNGTEYPEGTYTIDAGSKVDIYVSAYNQDYMFSPGVIWVGIYVNGKLVASRSSYKGINDRTTVSASYSFVATSDFTVELKAGAGEVGGIVTDRRGCS